MHGGQLAESHSGPGSDVLTFRNRATDLIMKQKKHANQEVAALKAEMAALKDRMHEDAAMHERALTAAGREKEHAKTEGKEVRHHLTFMQHA